MVESNTLSTKEHWDNVYRTSQRGYEGGAQDDYLWRLFQELFDAHFVADDSRKLLEIGCALSEFMPLFRKRYGYEVHGLDYSEAGCEATRRALARMEIELGGEILCRDVFEDNRDLNGQFDYVISFGVIEHFEDPVPVVRLFSDFLKPGGMLLTEIPATAGWMFSLFKLLDRSVFDMHVPIDRERMRTVHREAGLDVVFCDYFGTLNWSVLSSARPSFLKRAVSSFMSPLQRVVWGVSERTGFRPQSKVWSPYVVCVARKGR